MQSGDRLGICDNAKVAEDAKVVMQPQKSEDGRTELQRRLAEKPPCATLCLGQAD